MSYQDEVLNQLKSQSALLATISHQLEALAQASAPLSPGYRRRLAEYPGFDWQSIGATVVAQDSRGAAEVEWHGHRFDRATGEKFDAKFIIFSRPAPDWSQENKRYCTLIKFADYNNTPLAERQPAPGPAEPTQPGPASPPPIKPMDVQRTASDPAPLIEEAKSVQDAPGYYALATRLVKIRKDIMDLVGQIAQSTEHDTWQEKAVALATA